MRTSFEMLRQIQDEAVSSGGPVTDLLRRCQVLAARVGLPALEDWIRHELDGYPLDVELPSYRVMHGIARGHFFGAFGGGIQNAVLPAANLPEAHQDWARRAFIRQPIVALEEAAKKNDGNVRVPWPGNLIVIVQTAFYEDMALNQAWLEIPRTEFLSAVESVRNKILAFALAAEKHVSEGDIGDKESTAAALSTVFHTHIHGPIHNFAQGSTNVEQHFGIHPGDLPSLLEELRAIDVSDEDLAELAEAVRAEPPSGKPGTRVTAWLGKMIGKAASGAWSVGLNTATSVLPKLIERFYLPS